MTRRTIHRSPPGQFPARLSRRVISATSLSSSMPPSWATPGFHASAGSFADGVLIGCSDHPAAGEEHRPPRRGRCASRCLTSSWLAPAPSTRTRILRPEPGGDLPDRRGQHVLVVGEGVRAGVPGPQQHRQALAGISSPGRQRVEAVAFLPGGSRSLLVRARGDQRGVHVDHQPARQRLPGDDQPREPGRGLPDQRPHVRPRFRAGLRDPAPAWPCAPARSRARRTSGRSAPPPAPEPGAPAPRYRSCSWPPARSPPPSTPARHPGRTEARFPARRSAAPSPAVSPAWSAALRSRIAPACPTRPVPPPVTFRAWSQPYILHGEERSSPGDCTRVVTA